MEDGFVTHGIIPEDFTRDMERTPYFEISDGSHDLAVPVGTMFLNVNAGQLLCNMVFGSDWNIHFKDYLSMTGHEAFVAAEEEGLVDRLNSTSLLDCWRFGEEDAALVLASDHIKRVADREMQLRRRDGDRVSAHQICGGTHLRGNVQSRWPE